MNDASTVHKPVLHGRARECAAITGLLAGAARGAGGSLMVQGDLGLGKTALLAYAAGQAEGFAVLTCRGYSEGISFGCLRDLFDGYRGEAPLDRLSEMSRRGPVLCCVDDADAVDEPSLTGLAYAARRLASRRVAILFTSRGLTVTGVPTVRLSELDADASRQVLAASGVAESDVDRLAGVAQGNPLALVELAGSPGSSALPAGSALRQGYSSRLEGFSVETRCLLLLAAADDELDAAGLAYAAQLSDVDMSALAPAERHGIVRVTGGEIRFPQPLSRMLIYEAATLAQRRAAHLLLARVPDPHRQRLRRAMHLAAAAAGPDPALAAELEQAASGGEFSRSSAALETAARLSVCPAEAARRLVAAAQYAWQAGSLGRARSLLRDVPSDSGRAVAGRSQVLTGAIELRSGAASATLDHLVAASDRLAHSDRKLAINALMQAAEAVCFSGDYERFGEIARRAAVLRSGSDPARIQLVFEHISGFADTFTGSYSRAGASLRRVIALADQLDTAGALTAASAASLLLADDQTAYRTASRAAELARAAGEAAALPMALELKAYAEYWLGRYAAAESTSLEGVRVARECGQANYAGDHLGMLAVLAAIRGERETCLLRLQELAVPPGAGQMNRPKALGQWALAVLDVIASRPALAVERLTRIADQSVGNGHLVVQVMATPWLVEAAARSGDVAAARIALRAFDRWAASTGDPVRRALSQRCHALVAPRASATQHFVSALQLHSEADASFEAARTRLLYGQELRRSRRPRQAREHLQRALETFQQLSLPVWVEQARSELRASGQAVTPRQGAAAEALTAQQLQIARLVADGATNREVAAQLFLSPRTVEHHLRNIFTRLGIRSRVELTKTLT